MQTTAPLPVAKRPSHPPPPSTRPIFHARKAFLVSTTCFITVESYKMTLDFFLLNLLLLASRFYAHFLKDAISNNRLRKERKAAGCFSCQKMCTYLFWSRARDAPCISTFVSCSAVMKWRAFLACDQTWRTGNPKHEGKSPIPCKKNEC